MKKIILIVFMAALVTMPCLAKAIESVRLFEIHGTLWEKMEAGENKNENIDRFDGMFRGFFNGQVYGLLDQSCSFGGSYHQQLLIFYRYSLSSCFIGAVLR